MILIWIKDDKALNDDEVARADYDGDGKVTNDDALGIIEKLAQGD